MSLNTIDTAIEYYQAGKPVIIVDDEDRENEGDITLAAEHITPGWVNFMVRHARGLVCVAMAPDLCDRLQIPLMVARDKNRAGFGTNFTVSVEATTGVTTGISAADRARTISILANPASKPEDWVSPGHIFPLRAAAGGVLEREGQTEASVDLAALSGLTPAAVICEVMNEDGSMMRLTDLKIFAAEHDMPIISVADLKAYRKDQGEAFIGRAAPSPVRQISEANLPTPHGVFRATVFEDIQGKEHMLLSLGKPGDDTLPLVRLHSECLTGDVFGSARCDCGAQLDTAMARIASAGFGALLYLRQEGRGIGLGNKIACYAEQDKGYDTVTANERLGFSGDLREYDTAAAILRTAGFSRVKLLTNNPKKVAGLEAGGVTVIERTSLCAGQHAGNRDYLKTKVDKMGHVFTDGEVTV